MEREILRRPDARAYLGAAVSVATAIEGMEDEITRPFTKLVAAYYNTALAMMCQERVDDRQSGARERSAATGQRDE